MQQTISQDTIKLANKMLADALKAISIPIRTISCLHLNHYPVSETQNSDHGQFPKANMNSLEALDLDETFF